MCNRVVARGGGARSVCRRMCSALVMYAFEALRWATITGIRCFQDVVGCGCLITMLIPRKPVCGATNSLSGCSFRLEGKDGPLWRTSRMFGMWFSLPVIASMLSVWSLSSSPPLSSS